VGVKTWFEVGAIVALAVSAAHKSCERHSAGASAVGSRTGFDQLVRIGMGGWAGFNAQAFLYPQPGEIYVDENPFHGKANGLSQWY